MNKNFIGQDGFLWWMGVVEDTNDPLQLGRCRVRCFGYHPKRIDTNTPDEQPVPPEHLPWATCLMPANLQNFYGRPNAGDWVIGFFLDATDAQEPVILGILPGIPTVVNEYFSMQPRFAKTFTKTKNDETTNRSQLINTLHSLVNVESKQLVTLPEEGVYLSNSAIDSVRTLMSRSETRSDQTFAFYHKNGSILEIGDSANSNKQPITKATLQLQNGSSLEIRKEILNESGDTTDYVRLNHSSSGGSIELQTDITGGVSTDTLSISASGADISIEKTTLGTTLNIKHPKGTSITISPEGQITINSPESVSISSPKDVNVTGVPINLNGVVNVTGIGNLRSKIISMDAEIAVAKTLPLPS